MAGESDTPQRGDQKPELPPPPPKKDEAVEALKDLTKELKEDRKEREKMEEERAKLEQQQFEAEKQMAEEAKKSRESFAGLGIQALETFYDKEDEDVLRALGSVDEFASFVEKTREKVILEHSGGVPPTPDELNRLIVKRAEQDIVVKFSKLTRRVDKEKPSEFFEEIVQEGTFWGTIQIIRNQLLSKIQLLTEEAERREKLGDLPENLLSMKFLGRFSVKELGEKKIDIGGGETKTINRTVIMPIPDDRSISLGEFFSALHTQIDSEYVARSYMHNVRAIFLRGKGEHGFWDQLKNFALRLGTTDIDRLTLLPDNELFMSAFQLYTKYVEERFALHDWVHQPNMFINDVEGTTSEIEDKVLVDLRKLFPDAAEDPWRLRRALNFGVGLSKGVFLTEIEAAAWADPNVRTDKEGESTFVSYYTNDSAALTALNPLHHFLRWQQEGILKGPTLFMPVEGYKRSKFGLWDHVKLWERMNGFKRSWKKGKAAYDQYKTNPDEKTFFEILPNIGHVGSFITRSGWRLDTAYEGWMQYDDSGRLKVPESWKATENIGIEVMLSFIKNRVDASFLEPQKKDIARELYDRDFKQLTRGEKIVVLKNFNLRIRERKDFFEYLNKNYINVDINTGGVIRKLSDEIEKTREQLMQEIKDDPERSIFKRVKKDSVKEEDIYKRLLYKAIFGGIRNRIPTKFIRIERDRTSKDGVRIWDRIRSDLARQYGSQHWTPKQMDETMDNLLIVELRLRQETSNGMTKHLESSDKAKLGDYQGRPYMVTEASIRRILKEIGLEENKINNTVRLFNKINSTLLRNEEKEDDININNFSRDIQNGEFPFALAAEELETKFLAFRAAGESVISRAMGDTSNVEQIVTDKLQGYLDTLHTTSIDPKHDISNLIEMIDAMKKTVESIHGPEVGFKLAHHLAGITVAYFKKDTVSKNWLGRLGRLGRKNSIAAEVAGTLRGVWEWENGDIDNFVVELERRRILPKDPHELKTTPEIERRKPLKILGLEIPMGYKKVDYGKKFEFTGKKLRKDFGATKWDIASEFANKIIPLIMLFIVLQAIARAAKEEFGGKK